MWKYFSRSRDELDIGWIFVCKIVSGETHDFVFPMILCEQWSLLHDLQVIYKRIINKCVLLKALCFFYVFKIRNNK